MRRGVRLEVHRVVDPLIRKQAGYADHPAFGLADVGKPLPAHVSGLLAPLAVTMLVYDQNALLARSTRALLEHELQPALTMLVYDQNALLARSTRALLEHELQPTRVDLHRVPPRFRKELLQALRFLTLRSHNRLGVGQGSERLVALGRQQQTLQVTPESVALGAGAEKIV